MAYRPPHLPEEKPVLVGQIEHAKERIQRQIDEGESILESSGTLQITRSDFYRKATIWRKYTIDLLKHLFTADQLANEFLAATSVPYRRNPKPEQAFADARHSIRDGVATLISTQQRLEFYVPDSLVEVGVKSESSIESVRRSRKVFLVHGHDETLKQTVARFLEKLDLQPIILHEQPNGARTIIEKFEAHSIDVGFAVILLTPDDEGRARGSGELRARARQNVIAELGYFLGTLGRSRICVLRAEDVEVPSDFHGVLYVPVTGDWKLSLAREIKAAAIDIDMNKVF